MRFYLYILFGAFLIATATYTYINTVGIVFKALSVVYAAIGGWSFGYGLNAPQDKPIYIPYILKGKAYISLKSKYD